MSGTPKNEWVVLLGRRDQPTDGVLDYCGHLADALARRGIRVTIEQMRWAEIGWIRGLIALWLLAGKWKGRWVLVQYTALAWSRRGFPCGAVVVMAALRLRRARTAVMFHDWTGYTGPRLLDRIRWNCQRSVMRRLALLAERDVLPVPPEKAAWLQNVRTPVAFISIGANIPVSPVDMPRSDQGSLADSPRCVRTVGVFGVTGAEPGVKETDVIASAIKTVASRLKGVRLVVFGRGSEESRPLFERALNGAGVELSVLGLLSAEEVAKELSRADAMLFVRGEMMGHRGSAIAGIACGTPVIGYGDPGRAFPLSEAGVVFVPPGDGAALAEALAHVLTDDVFRQSLREKNWQAHVKYFSWDRIAQRFGEALADG